MRSRFYKKRDRSSRIKSHAIAPALLQADRIRSRFEPFVCHLLHEQNPTYIGLIAA